MKHQSALKIAFSAFLCLVLICSLTLGVAAAPEAEYFLSDGWYREAQIPTDVIRTMDEMMAQGGELTMDVRELKQTPYYEILVYGPHNSYYEVYGAIYLISDSYYYLNYSMLGNQHFDADGNFSYRSGEVTLKNVDACRAAIAAAVVEITAEDFVETEEDFGESEELAQFFFWVGFVFLGFLLPIPFLLLGIFLPLSQKLGKPRYWRLLTWLAIAWMALSLLLMILILLA